MQFINLYEDIYDETFCDEVIDAFEKMKAFGLSEDEKANHDHSDMSIRRDAAHFFDKTIETWPDDIKELHDDLTTRFYTGIEKAVTSYMKQFGMHRSSKLHSHDFKVQKYSHKKQGGYYAFHWEQSGENYTLARRALTYMLYLNDVPEGEGETEFLYQGYRCQPKKGTLVVWPASFTHTHRGNPVYTTDKYIATGWMLYDSGESIGSESA